MNVRMPCGHDVSVLAYVERVRERKESVYNLVVFWMAGTIRNDDECLYLRGTRAIRSLRDGNIKRVLSRHQTH